MKSIFKILKEKLFKPEEPNYRINWEDESVKFLADNEFTLKEDDVLEYVTESYYIIYDAKEKVIKKYVGSAEIKMVSNGDISKLSRFLTKHQR
jgi:hypothetical protein